MCGRFVQNVDQTDWDALSQALGAAASSAPPKRFNLAPTQLAAAFARPKGASDVEAIRLGFGMPRGPSGLVINARSETVHERPLFRGLLKSRRAIVVASAFYEWTPGSAGKKQPHCIARTDGALLCFAALRERGEGAGGVILTTAANSFVSDLHSRMPVVLELSAAKQWLDASLPQELALAMLHEPPACELKHWEVATSVNSPRHDAEDCVLPTPSAQQGSLGL